MIEDKQILMIVAAVVGLVALGIICPFGLAGGLIGFFMGIFTHRKYPAVFAKFFAFKRESEKDRLIADLKKQIEELKKTGVKT